jgi:hypothetical protein
VLALTGAAAAAELGALDAPEPEVLVPLDALLPQAASRAAAAATPGATHHRLRILITPFESEAVPPP